MEEFEERFYRDPYCTSLTTRVIAAVKEKDGWGIVLEDTVFYPEGGGQPGDTGRLNGIRVKDTIRKDGIIYHLTDSPIPLGTEVKAEIDWGNRFSHMQEHTGEHMVSGLIHQKYGYDNVGFHMGKVIQVDFNGPLTSEDIQKIERKANEAIWQNLPVEVSYPSDAQLADLSYRSKKELTGRVRIVTIPGVDVCACCGTHVAHTGEVGLIRILSAVHHKGGMRLTMAAGRKAYEEITQIAAQNEEVSHLLSVPVDETASAVTKLAAEKDQEKARADAWMMKYLAAQAEKDREPLFVFDETGLDRLMMRKAASLALTRGHDTAIILNTEETGRISYLIMSATLPLNKIVKELNAKLNGRGGGKDDMVQGSFTADHEAVMQTIREVLS